MVEAGSAGRSAPTGGHRPSMSAFATSCRHCEPPALGPATIDQVLRPGLKAIFTMQWVGGGRSARRPAASVRDGDRPCVPIECATACRSAPTRSRARATKRCWPSPGPGGGSATCDAPGYPRGTQLPSVRLPCSGMSFASTIRWCL